jgi:ferrochelatase
MSTRQKGILLVNLGTPNSYNVSDVRTYLKEFLLDGRVIDIPAIPRNLLVRGIIAPFRAPRSAKTYQKIWTDEGSPLLVYSQRMKVLLQEALGEEYCVALSMRYQHPNLETGLETLRKHQVSSIKIIPLFPQYASATTGSIHQRVMEIVSQWQTIPEISFVNSFFNHPKLIKTFANNGRNFDIGSYDHVLFSYHGLPQRQLGKADYSQQHCLKGEHCCEQLVAENRFCYSAQCFATSKALAEELALDKKHYTTCFQSRLGRAEWMKPYTSDVIERLAKQGTKRLLVFCPAFVADCLETIFEIGEEYAEDFKRHGGETLTLVPSLNDNPLWIEALKDIAVNN